STLDGVPDGQVAGSLLVDAEHQPYLLVMDDSDYAGPPAARPKASFPIWKWARLTIGDSPSIEVLSGDRTGGSILPVALGDEVYLPLFTGRDRTDFSPFNDGRPESFDMGILGLSFSTVKLR